MQLGGNCQPVTTHLTKSIMNYISKQTLMRIRGKLEYSDTVLKTCLSVFFKCFFYRRQFHTIVEDEDKSLEEIRAMKERQENGSAVLVTLRTK